MSHTKPSGKIDSEEAQRRYQLSRCNLPWDKNPSVAIQQFDIKMLHLAPFNVTEHSEFATGSNLATQSCLVLNRDGEILATTTSAVLYPTYVEKTSGEIVAQTMFQMHEPNLMWFLVFLENLHEAEGEELMYGTSNLGHDDTSKIRITIFPRENHMGENTPRCMLDKFQRNALQTTTFLNNLHHI